MFDYGLLKSRSVDLSRHKASLGTRVAEFVRKTCLRPICKLLSGIAISRAEVEILEHLQKDQKFEITGILDKKTQYVSMGNTKKLSKSLVMIGQQKDEHSQQLPSCDRKLIIWIPGNDIDTLGDMRYMKRSISTDNIFINYSSKTLTKEDIIEYCLAVIKNALDQGYDPKNICIAGFSFGAFFATEVVIQSKKRKILQPEQEFEDLVLLHPLRSLHDRAVERNYDIVTDGTVDSELMAMRTEQQKPLGFLDRILRALAELVSKIFGWHIDLEKYIREEHIPTKSISIVYSRGDRMIGDNCNLAPAIYDLQQEKNVKFINSGDDKHTMQRLDLLAKNSHTFQKFYRVSNFTPQKHNLTQSFAIPPRNVLDAQTTLDTAVITDVHEMGRTPSK